MLLVPRSGESVWYMAGLATTASSVATPPVLHRPQIKTEQKGTVSPNYYGNRGLVKVIPTQGVVQHSHRSSCLLPTEAPGRHSAQTRTQASPDVA